MDYLQYVNIDSFLHRLDPRTKFIFLLAMAVLTSVIKSGVALLFLFVCFFALWRFCHIGKYILQLAKKLKVLLLFIFLLWWVLGLFQPLPPEGGVIFWQTSFSLFGKSVNVCFDWYDLYKGLVYALRIFLMISSFYTVLLTTNFSEIILGLCKWKIPYSVAFAIGLVFQIIPLIIGELVSIMEAQSSRGLEIDECKWYVKVKNYITFSLPLLFRVIGKGQAISFAMHYYQLDFSVSRTSYKQIQAGSRDYIFIGLTAIVVAVTVLLRIFFYVAI